MHIRKAKISEYKVLANVHVASRISAYRDILPPNRMMYEKSIEFLDNRLEARKEILKSGQTVHIAEVSGKIVGFASGGKQRNQDFEVEGELYSIYVLEKYWREGIGTALFNGVKEELQEKGYTSFCLRAIAGNKSADKFYKKMGGVAVRSERRETPWGYYDVVGYIYHSTDPITT